jgi:hypothetical protein
MATLGVKRVLAYETLSSTEQGDGSFRPNVFVYITPYIDEKIEIMHLYKTEIQDGWMPRAHSAIKAQARLRGAAIGVDYAEAFMLVREIVV